MKIQGTPAARPTTNDAGPAPAAAEAPAAAAAVGWTAKKVAAPTAAAAPSEVETRTRAAAEKYFEAFGKRDGAALKTLYRPDATFKDDMFTLSKGESITNMWKKAPPFATFKAEIISVKGNEVHAKWKVDYEMFGNKVHNEIDSVIKFDANGKISEQTESWDRAKWMKQALPMVPRWAQGLAYALMRPLLSASVGG